MLEEESPAGEILPEILPTLTNADVTFRRGQFHLLAAVPGGGKTLLALWWAVKSKVPVYYFSADSDKSTMTERVGAILLGKTTKEIKSMLHSDARVLVEEAIAEHAMHLRFDWNPGPDLGYIEDSLRAYCEVYGDMPAAVIVDNVLNVHGNSDNEWTSLRETSSALHTLARETESAFIALHHNSTNGSKEHQPAPLNALLGQISHLPELVLSVALDSERDIYRLCAVKNRHGAASPKAEKVVQVAVDASRMTLYNSAQDLQLDRTKREWQ